MSDPPFDESLHNQFVVALSRVAYFHNLAEPGPGICLVCRGSSPEPGLCTTCVVTNAQLKGATCDHTFFLAYADGSHPVAMSQSAHTMHSYEAVPAPQQCVEDHQCRLRAVQS